MEIIKTINDILNLKKKPIIAFPHKPGAGGPGSFQSRFEKALKERGWDIIYANSKRKADVILIVGGTKKIAWLLIQKLQGIPIIYRLDGINWLYKKINTPFKKKITDILRNILMQIIHSFFATIIVYQSRFVKNWWIKKGWFAQTEKFIIHNSVNLIEFKKNKTKEKITLLCVEGTIDYSPYAIDLLNDLQEKLISHSSFHSLRIYGGFQNQKNEKKLSPKIDYRGKVDRKNLPKVYQNAIYLSLDVNAACPNTVIEALASGIPVIGFDTGALKELVGSEAGEIVPYGSDPWELGKPDTSALVFAANKVLKNWDVYSQKAREKAESNYGVDLMVQKYLELLTPVSS